MKPLKDKGNCDCCVASIDVILYELHGMKMCESCYNEDADASAKAVEANSMIQQSRDVDTSIQIKPDVFGAATTAAIQVMASIQNDPAIADADKDYAMARESLRRYKHMKEVIFNEKVEFAKMIADKENEMRAWQTQVQTFAARVGNQRREEFRNFDIAYQPVVKSVKSTKSTPAKKFNKAELADAAKKWNVPAALVQMIASQRNMTADQAAQELASSMSSSKKTN